MKIIGYNIVKDTYVGITFDIDEEIDKEKKLYYLIENVQLCCETFSVEYNSEDLEKLINTEITSISSHKSTSATDYTETSSEIVKIQGVKEGEDIEVFIEIYNNHNGYYKHQVKISYYEYDKLVLYEDSM